MFSDDVSAERLDHESAGEPRPQKPAEVSELRMLIERAREACVAAQELIRKLDGKG